MRAEASNDDVIAAIYDLMAEIEKLNRDVCHELQCVADNVMMYSGD